MILPRLCVAISVVLGALASAATLETSYRCGVGSGPGDPGVVHVATNGPLNTQFSCNPGSANQSPTANGALSVSYSPSGQGSGISFSGFGTLFGGTYSADTGPNGNGLSITSSTLPFGTPIALAFEATLTGSYSYTVDVDRFILDSVTVQVGTPGAVSGNSVELRFCSPTLPIGDIDCTVNGKSVPRSVSGSGSVLLPVEAKINTTIGAQGLTLSLVEQQEFLGGGSFNGDFLDPFILNDVRVTDPSTGALLSGVTVTGFGGVYPVNVESTVPEPDSLSLLASGLLAFLVFRKSSRLVTREKRNQG